MAYACLCCGRKFRNAYHMRTHAATHKAQAKVVNEQMGEMVARATRGLGLDPADEASACSTKRTRLARR